MYVYTSVDSVILSPTPRPKCADYGDTMYNQTARERYVAAMNKWHAEAKVIPHTEAMKTFVRRFDDGNYPAIVKVKEDQTWEQFKEMLLMDYAKPKLTGLHAAIKAQELLNDLNKGLTWTGSGVYHVPKDFTLNVP